MSMGVIGSAVYVNQQIVDVASLQNGYNSRIEFQHIMAQVIANEKEQEISDIRPAEENHKVDPDKQYQKDKPYKQKAYKAKKDIKFSLHKLDIKV